MAMKNPPGRPPKLNRPIRQPVGLQLEPELIELARTLGDGNFAEGVRRAIAKASTLEPSSQVSDHA